MPVRNRKQQDVPTAQKRSPSTASKVTTTSTFWAKVFFAILGIVSLINHVSISMVQKTPYMDEIFHVQQSQQYCKGNYREWDQKITTLPGLYVLPSVLTAIFGSYFQCTTFLLRSTNLIMTSGIYWTIYYILGASMKQLPEKKQAFMAYTLTLFPLNYFFTFLYYTDQLSTLLVLLMWYFVGKNRCNLSAIAGAYAVFTRQTNIIWVMWVAFFVTWDLLRPDLSSWNKLVVQKFRSKENDTNEKKPTNRNSAVEQTKGRPAGFDLETNIIFWSKCIVKIAPKVIPYAIIGLAFLGFVVVNGGIVVGDRLAHQASINLPQVFYFAFFTGFMLSPLMALSGPTRIFSEIKKHWILFFVFIILGLTVVHFNTVVHPYLLADNRHYAFYVWKRFYEWYPVTRYLLVPCYIVVWFWISSSVKWDPVLFLGFVICLAGSVVPQKLLEWRYFIIPFYLIRLNLDYTEWKHLIFECLFYTVLNAFTIYQFLMNPFVIEGNFASEVSRFMW